MASGLMPTPRTLDVQNGSTLEKKFFSLKESLVELEAKIQEFESMYGSDLAGLTDRWTEAFHSAHLLKQEYPSKLEALNAESEESRQEIIELDEYITAIRRVAHDIAEEFVARQAGAPRYRSLSDGIMIDVPPGTEPDYPNRCSALKISSNAREAEEHVHGRPKDCHDRMSRLEAEAEKLLDDRKSTYDDTQQKIKRLTDELDLAEREVAEIEDEMSKIDELIERRNKLREQLRLVASECIKARKLEIDDSSAQAGSVGTPSPNASHTSAPPPPPPEISARVINVDFSKKRHRRQLGRKQRGDK